MSVRIISDSACDMSAGDAKASGVTIIPLKTLFGDEEYLDGVTITAEEFYDKLENCQVLPSTSQITPAEFMDVFRDVVEAGDEAVVITLASKFSGTFQGACLAASEHPGKIWPVDSETVTIGQRILVDYAVRLRDDGMSAMEIAEALNDIKKRVNLIARVDTLEYLMRGGRLSRAAAIAGTVLHIKPVISISVGEINILGKARGSRQSNNLLTEHISRRGGVDFSMPYMLAYSGNDDALLKGYIENSRALWENHASELPISTIGSTIGTHAGPGAIAVAFYSLEIK